MAQNSPAKDLKSPKVTKKDDVHMDEGYLKVMGKGKKERIVPIGNNAQRALQLLVPFQA